MMNQLIAMAAAAVDNTALATSTTTEATADTTTSISPAAATAIVKQALGAVKLNHHTWFNFEMVALKHLGPVAAGSRFLLPEGSGPDELLQLLNRLEWRAGEGSSEELLIAQSELPADVAAEMTAVEIGDLPDETVVTCTAIAGHPGLRARGFEHLRRPTRLVTIIIELSGHEYDCDSSAMGLPEGTPVFATVFPGETLPRNERGVVERTPIGELSVFRAKALGWRVVNV